MGSDGKTVVVSGAAGETGAEVAQKPSADGPRRTRGVAGIEQFTELRHVHVSVHDDGGTR